MQSKMTHILRWAGAATMLLLIVLMIFEGTWSLHLYHSWLFVGIATFAMLMLILTAVCDCSARKWLTFFSHSGLALLLLGGMMGAVVEIDVKMVVDSWATENVSYDSANNPVQLPFAIQLKNFHIYYYDDEKTPKQYTALLMLKDKDGVVEASTSVNHPAHYRGWWIYQSDYDRANQDFVVLQLVKDPFLPVVYLGFLLLTIGAILQLVRTWHSWRVLPIVLLTAIAFTMISLARIELKTLVPALRSVWFFPHIMIYMLAYSLMAISLIAAVIPQQTRWYKTDSRIARKLLKTTSSLLLIGMLCGAVWAKEAWGQYWTWDAKECWAAVTWLITVVGWHILPKHNKRWFTILVLLTAFAALQITWYGVNHLPSAKYSMHTYNK